MHSILGVPHTLGPDNISYTVEPLNEGLIGDNNNITVNFRIKDTLHGTDYVLCTEVVLYFWALDLCPL